MTEKSMEINSEGYLNRELSVTEDIRWEYDAQSKILSAIIWHSKSLDIEMISGPTRIVSPHQRKEIWVIDRGILHRDQGPAYLFDHGNGRTWYQNGRLHRLDGPAYISDTDGIAWALNGRYLRFHSFCAIGGILDDQRMVLELTWSGFRNAI